MGGRVIRQQDLGARIKGIERRLALEPAGQFAGFSLVSQSNSAVQNQSVPPSGSFDGSTKFDVAPQVGLECRFTLTRRGLVFWLSYATLKLTGASGNFAYLTTAVSLSPWNPSAIIAESGSQIFDRSTNAYLNSTHMFSTPALEPGVYEARQRIWGDSVLVAAYYQGNIDVYRVS
jgi:hypothetical protein